MNSYRAVVLASSILLLGASMGFAQGPTMSFFATSVGLGDGANLGGLEGADAHCQALAETAGFGHRTWRAYLIHTAVSFASFFSLHPVESM